MRSRSINIIGVIALFCLQNTYSQKIIFDRDFAPQEGLVKHVERPLRDDIFMNGTWQFIPGKVIVSVLNLFSRQKKTFNFEIEHLKTDEKVVHYNSFRMYSPRSLNDLLIEPDMPRLDMHLGVFKDIDSIIDR